MMLPIFQILSLFANTALANCEGQFGGLKGKSNFSIKVFNVTRSNGETETIRGVSQSIPISDSKQVIAVIDSGGKAHLIDPAQSSVVEVPEVPEITSRGASNGKNTKSQILDIDVDAAKKLICEDYSRFVSSDMLERIKSAAIEAMSAQNRTNRIARVSFCGAAVFVGSLYGTLASLRNFDVFNAITLHGSNFTFSVMGMGMLDACLSAAHSNPQLNRIKLAALALGTSGSNFLAEYKSDDWLPGSAIKRTDEGDLISGQIGVATYVVTAMLLEQKYGISIKKICK